MTSATQAVPPPALVDVPHHRTNAFGALGDASSVDGDSLPKEADDDGIPVADGSLQAVIDASFAAVFGPDSSTMPTPRRIKSLFDEGARVVDRILSDIRGDQDRHVARVDNHVSALTDSAQYDRGALRAKMAMLRTETEDALGPTIRNLSSLAALARQMSLDVKNLVAASEENASAISALCQEMVVCTA